MTWTTQQATNKPSPRGTWGQTPVRRANKQQRYSINKMQMLCMRPEEQQEATTNKGAKETQSIAQTNLQRIGGHYECRTRGSYPLTPTRSPTPGASNTPPAVAQSMNCGKVSAGSRFDDVMLYVGIEVADVSFAAGSLARIVLCFGCCRQQLDCVGYVLTDPDYVLNYTKPIIVFLTILFKRTGFRNEEDDQQQLYLSSSWRRPKLNQLEHINLADDEDQLQALKSKVNQLSIFKKKKKRRWSWNEEVQQEATVEDSADEERR
ncbi:aspartic protein Asp1-like [Dorcoceras hygrometricum]|uniref:Aspartic protein Asp1-like n=1 Tax=Dorcoceras hygrometricum TaxID=472368 RepID=A0A2Z7ADY7_9LAMI|nr:aspartic protein Asp1-like [Dorcoceras hygrometricum]